MCWPSCLSLKHTHFQLPFYSQKFCQEEKSHGVVSSLVNWVTSGVTLPSFIEKHSYPECSWLMYMILTMENQFERDTTLWPSMQDELLENPKMGIDQSLKVKIFHTFYVNIQHKISEYFHSHWFSYMLRQFF